MLSPRAKVALVTSSEARLEACRRGVTHRPGARSHQRIKGATNNEVYEGRRGSIFPLYFPPSFHPRLINSHTEALTSFLRATKYCFARA